MGETGSRALLIRWGLPAAKGKRLCEGSHCGQGLWAQGLPEVGGWACGRQDLDLLPPGDLLPLGPPLELAEGTDDFRVLHVPGTWRKWAGFSLIRDSSSFIFSPLPCNYSTVGGNNPRKEATSQEKAHLQPGSPPCHRSSATGLCDFQPQRSPAWAGHVDIAVTCVSLGLRDSGQWAVARPAPLSTWKRW